ncbi:hypothetical protein DUNSADRAFT_18323 [Dunaliella salina]|uniref:Encoded protein n=1 Tax=Dunaliella salina TaxID=3046 RepID=A0ABQ7GZA2_DUNSA|nr:hypothetical protein DUNSADRAFT_18323 [Dunaliella salina]|eukprot:KAF5839909.1 hypothetical protein DUNSADRAFT_18323 [Dunaliella salina]
MKENLPHVSMILSSLFATPNPKCGIFQGSTKDLLDRSKRGKGTTVTLRREDWTRRARGSRVIVQSEKQYVPFGGRSPEAVAAAALNRLFTFAAARIVLAQLEGSGSRGALGAYNKPGFDALSAQLEEKIEDADEWVQRLMQKDAGIALRLMDVRLAYAKEDFEWDVLRNIAIRDLNKGSMAIMKKTAAASFAANAEEPSTSRQTQDDSSSDEPPRGSGSSPPTA